MGVHRRGRSDLGQSTDLSADKLTHSSLRNTMPITLHKIANNTATVTIKWGEDTSTIVYYPGRVTEVVFARLNAFASMDMSTIEAGFSDYNKMLANLIQSWDLYEDEDEQVMFPIDPTRFPELPVGFRGEILQAIMGDLRPEGIAPPTS